MQPGQRVRSHHDGQLGFLEEDETGYVVRIDRRVMKGYEPERVPYSPNDWYPDTKPLFDEGTKNMICYAADLAYRNAKGDMTGKDWRSLGDAGRARVKGGPKAGDPIRQKLWQTIYDLLEKA